MKILMLLALLLPTSGFATYEEPIQAAAEYQAHVVTAMSPKSFAGWKNASLHRHMVQESKSQALYTVLNNDNLEFYPGQTKKMVGMSNYSNGKTIVGYQALQAADFQYANLQTKIVCVAEVKETAGGLLGFITGFIEKIQQVIQFVEDILGFLNGANLLSVQDAVQKCESQNY